MGVDNPQKDSEATSSSSPSLRCLQRVKNALRITTPGANPVPWKTFLIILYALFGCCYSLTFIFSFLPEQILYFGHKEEEKGYYAGIVASSLFAGRMIGGLFWGFLSDIIGRKPVLVICVVLISLSNLSYGLAPTVIWAAVIRFIGGACNGVVGTIKTIMYEVSDDTNQAVGIAIVGLGWGLGIVAGPLFSGYLSDPVEKYPYVFGGNKVLTRFPYLLSCSVAFILTITSVIPVWWKLSETLDKKKGRNKEIVKEVNIEAPTEGDTLIDKDVKPSEPSDLGQQQIGALPLQVTNQQKKKPQFSKSVENISYADHRMKDSVLDRYGLGCSLQSLDDIVDVKVHESLKLKEPLETIKHTSSGEEREDKTSCDKSQAVEESGCAACGKKLCQSALVRLLCHNREFAIATALYTFIAFCAIGSDEIFAVWCSTDPKLGGLGFSPEEIGIVMGYAALPLLVINIYLFPWMVARFGLKITLAIGIGYHIASWPLVPAMRLLVGHHKILMALLLINLGLQKITQSITFCITSIFINNSVKPADAGSANGLSMTFSAGFRTLSPTLGGALYSWSIVSGVKIGWPLDVNAVFLLFTIIFLISQITAALVPDSLAKQSKKKNK